MRCRSALTRVDALRTRELSHEERSAVESHLKTCKSCDQSLHDVERLTNAVKAALAIAPLHGAHRQRRPRGSRLSGRLAGP